MLALQPHLHLVGLSLCSARALLLWVGQLGGQFTQRRWSAYVCHGTGAGARMLHAIFGTYMPPANKARDCMEMPAESLYKLTPALTSQTEDSKAKYFDRASHLVCYSSS